MSDHERFEALLSALLDGELSAEEEAEMREHMAGCAECAAMYEAFAAVGAAMKADAEDVPDTLHDGIMTKVRTAEKAQKTQNKIVRLRPMLTAAACLIVLVGTVIALKNSVGMRKGAATETAEAPAMAFSASGSTSAAGGAVEAPMLLAAPEAAAVDDGAAESAPEEIAFAKEAPAAESAMQDTAPAANAPETDARAAKQNPRLAEAKSFTMRLEAVSDGALTGVVTDEGDQGLVQTGEQVTVLLDGAELLSPEIGKELTVYIDAQTTVEDGRISMAVMIRSAE